MGGRAHIIVVDDEPELRDMVRAYLSGHGFEVSTAAGGGELRALMAERAADLLLLDVNLPGEDGFSLARSIRVTSDAPIVMLTAADEVVDRVVGLELGADDYLTKPFDLRELRARINAVLRRRAPPAAAAPTQAAPGSREPERVPFGLCALDLAGRRLIGADGEEIKLTAMEFDLLHAFATHPNRVLSRDRLLDLAHNRDREPFDRSIDIRVTRIRKKVEPDPAKPRFIKTVRGAGYIFVPDSRRADP